MDVLGSDPGISDLLAGSFLTQADIGAFDVMGYEIDHHGIPPPPQPATPSRPVTNQILRTNPLILAWDSGGSTERFDAFLTNAAGSVVFRANDLLDSTLAVPLATLLPAQSYEFFVVSYNWRGYQRMNVPFQTACTTDFDDGSNTGTPDGGVTIEDLLYFLVRFEAGC